MLLWPKQGVQAQAQEKAQTQLHAQSRSMRTRSPTLTLRWPAQACWLACQPRGSIDICFERDRVYEINFERDRGDGKKLRT